MLIGIVCTISRPERVGHVLETLKSICRKPHKYDLILMVDNDQIKKFDLMVTLNEMAYQIPVRAITVEHTKKAPPRKLDAETRRTRIADLKELSKGNVKDDLDYVFSFEDDTVLGDDCIEILIKSHQTLSKNWPVGMVEGVQIGRWGVPYVGAWRVNDVYAPTEYTSQLPPEKKILGVDHHFQQIDAGGFYCYLTTPKLYKRWEYDWYPPLGPDVHWSLQLRRAGYVNFIDWHIECGHLVGSETIFPDGNEKQVKFNREGNRWQTKVE